MPLEIEHKFLVSNNSFRLLAKPVLYRQGYLAILADREIRVRIAGDTSCITIKSKISETVRHEFEYEIPTSDAELMINKLCSSQLIEKYRYRILFAGMIWEVDEFIGENAGLVIAEIELENENQYFEKPDWIGKEVSGDDRYLNAYLSVNPFKNW
ncbi:MAG: CYTH domain-containing protein [Lentimicrobium sp.]|nr:CYTH domain-containing protein [Lentimicrobium sp.]